MYSPLAQWVGELQHCLPSTKTTKPTTTPSQPSGATTLTIRPSTRQNDGLIIVFVGGIHRCTKRAPAAAPLCRRPRGCCSPAPTPPLVYYHEAKNITPAASLKQFQRLYVSIRSHPPVCCHHHHHHQRSQPLPPQLPRINVPKRLSGRSVDDSRCLHRHCML